jgi:hypothetical protein
MLTQAVNRTICDVDFLIGQERKSICITFEVINSFGNGCRNYFAGMAPELASSREMEERADCRWVWLS